MDSRSDFNGGSFFSGVMLGALVIYFCKPTEVVHRHEKESEYKPTVTIDDPCGKGNVKVRLWRFSAEDGEAVVLSNAGMPSSRTERAYVISYGNDVTPVVPFGWTCPHKN